jgi:hypothetical protein
MPKRVVIAIVAGLGVIIVPSIANAEGGNGASFCSNSGAPVRDPAGPVLGDLSTYGNAGEIISFIARGDGRPERPGQLVNAACNPSG